MATFEDLKSKLKEIFQLDHSELDFGLYRIMNIKSKEVLDFIENDLQKEVNESLKTISSQQEENLKRELEEQIKKAKELGVDPNSLPKITNIKEQIKNNTSVSDDIKNDIYSKLYDFFSRYYEGGDFLSLRRYKKDVYALPYEGEEVKLHWANADQYYIKSNENFTNYTFTLPNKEQVRFEVVEADVAQNNNKEEKRFFKLIEENPVRKENNEYIISFSYLVDNTIKNSKNAQKDLNLKTIKLLLENPILLQIKKELLQLDEKKEISLIEKYLTDFTEKNTLDYFIHKDLSSFLNRELDFYIKNEVMHIDDIKDEKVEQNIIKYLSKIKVLKEIAQKIIGFLSSLEEFQKKIWLKKKLILETNYCITLDRVPENLYQEIIENKAQIQEWIKLFAINELKNYSENLNIEFLKENKYLVLDTAFFSDDFKYELLSNIANIDKQCNGLLINSENFQALNLLQEKYNQKVKCIYIDPPYNTGSDSFIYKDGYKDSSWLSMMRDRLVLAKESLTDDGVIFISIDENEFKNIGKLCDEIFNSENFVECLVYDKKSAPKGVPPVNMIVGVHEYIFVYAKNYSKFRFKGIERSMDDFSNPDNDPRGIWRNTNIKSTTSATKYTIIDPKTGNEFTDTWAFSQSELNAMIEENRLIFPDTKTGQVRAKEFYNEFKNESIPIKSSLGLYDAQWNTEMLVHLMGCKCFLNPKHLQLMIDIIKFTLIKGNSIVFDFFAGSGTTGHAVINLNKQDNGNRKYILVEVEKYFDTVTKPRIEKVIYSKDWKDGKPISREGISHCFKYIRLESYEDCLDNLSLSNKTLKQGDMLSQNKELQKDYMNYMLDLETKDSLFNIKIFEKPFDYKMKVTRNSESTEVKVDLIETFNYLLGLTVKSIQKVRDILYIEGTNEKQENILIVWRDITKTNNEQLNKWFESKKISTIDSEFDVIYVNGDNNLDNEKLKVKLIEQEFFKRMFDIKDI